MLIRDPPCSGKADLSVLCPRSGAWHENAVETCSCRSSRSLPGRGDDDFPSSVSLFEIADRLRGLAQRIRPVDDRRDLARLDELLQSCQIPLVWSRGVVRFPGVTGHPLGYEP